MIEEDVILIGQLVMAAATTAVVGLATVTGFGLRRLAIKVMRRA